MAATRWSIQRPGVRGGAELARCVSLRDQPIHRNGWEETNALSTRMNFNCRQFNEAYHILGNDPYFAEHTASRS